LFHLIIFFVIGIFELYIVQSKLRMDMCIFIKIQWLFVYEYVLKAFLYKSTCISRNCMYVCCSYPNYYNFPTYNIYIKNFLNVSHLTIYLGHEEYFHPLLLIKAFMPIINGTIIVPRSIFESLDISMFLSILMHEEIWLGCCSIIMRK